MTILTMMVMKMIMIILIIIATQNKHTIISIIITYHSMLLPTCTEVTKMVLEEVPIPLQKRTFSTG